MKHSRHFGGSLKKDKKSLGKKIVPVVAICAVLIFSYLFGSSILENAHLSYIRYKARNVVTIINSHGGGGTGFIVKGKSGKKYILTNNHICESAQGMPLLAIFRGDRYLTVPFKTYSENDLCAIEAPSTATSYFDVAGGVRMGERVYSVGHPLLEPLVVTQGELSNFVNIQIQAGFNVPKQKCTGNTYEYIDLSDNESAGVFGIYSVCIRNLEANGSSVNILPGNSGSPTLNIYGHVVGVVFAANNSGVHSYHVPLGAVKDFLSEL